ncbi:MAG: glycosyltransferase family 4 protein [Desulfatibacillaceae bacterium]|nr:glycosyltransferase family 4 protein [Desulfatibacillaceae bacterium]
MPGRPLTVIQMLPALHSGGVEEDALEMAAFLAANGHKSIVVSAGGRLAKRLCQQGSTHISLPVGEKGPVLLKALYPLRRLVAGCRPDILHLRSRVPAWAGFAAIKSLPARKRPAVVTSFHGTYSVHAGSAIMTKGDRVIAISNFIADHIRDNYGVFGSRVALIPGGYDETRFCPKAVDPARVSALAARWGLMANKAPVIMLPARLTGWKGHKYLIEALALIKEAWWIALFVGDVAENPGLVKELKSTIKDKGLAERVFFVGRADDMPAAYLLADLVVSASIEPEAFGRVSVEAMAMGRAVVATALGGSLETVAPGVTGWLAPHNSPPAFARAILDAVTDREKREAFGAAAAQRALTAFSAERMCSSTLRLYYELLSEKKRL